MIKRKKTLFFKAGSIAQCADEWTKITSDRWILKTISEGASTELDNLGNNLLKMKGKTGSRKKLFSDVEKVLFRKEKNRLIQEEAVKKVNETEVGFVSAIFLRRK